MRLEGKTAIVTGGSSGFGEGIARRFAEEGCNIVIADINDAGGQKVVSDINASGGKALYQRTDVTRSDDWAQLIQSTLDIFGGLTTVVNNAGAAHSNLPIAEIPEEDFDRVITVNVKSLYHSARHCVPVLRENEIGGVFINMASTSGIRPRPGMTWYSASKGAIITASRSMAVELASDKIRVCVLNPVAAATPLLKNFLGDADDEAIAKLGETIPLGRLATALDVANAALWLSSDEAEFITGTCIEIDGGRCV